MSRTRSGRRRASPRAALTARVDLPTPPLLLMKQTTLPSRPPGFGALPNDGLGGGRGGVLHELGQRPQAPRHLDEDEFRVAAARGPDALAEIADGVDDGA
jgi:hypothetical protein